MKKRIDSGNQQDENMNWDNARNNWESYMEQIQERWQELSSEQVSGIAGRRVELRRALQETYQLDEAQAEQQVREFENDSERHSGMATGRGETERMREFGSGNERGA